jgi:hypothetical protein
MGSPHARHFPRSHNHPKIGTLSYGLIGVLHCGHLDPGETIDSSSGIRVMQTFRKLPTIVPSKKKNRMNTSSTGHFEVAREFHRHLVTQEFDRFAVALY